MKIRVHVPLPRTRTTPPVSPVTLPSATTPASSAELRSLHEHYVRAVNHAMATNNKAEIASLADSYLEAALEVIS